MPGGFLFMATEQDGESYVANEPQNTSAEQDRAVRARSGGPAFVVEFGDDNCRTITINTLKLRVRGRFSSSVLHKRPMGGRDMGQAMNRMPDIPGMRLSFDPRTKTCRLYDPLEADKTLLDRVNSAAEGVPAIIKSGGRFTFVPASEHDFSDPDRLKTLLVELLNKVESGSCVVVEGELPTRDQLTKIPGRRLHDPWNSSATKPRYSDEAEEALHAAE